MKAVLAFVLPALFTIISLSASAGVAPTDSNSALAQSGAKIAAPAKPSAEDREVKNDQHEHTSKDSVK